ncbi:MAG: hypothetical protein JRN66_06280 [Nitrososphaerota archaeon]|jgi:hypothetical protein|nr:hypothetical protein [Nitrososphaerota archaeon]
MQGKIEGLRNHFHDSWKEIAALSIIRTLRPTPLKYAESAWSKLYLSEEIDLRKSSGK